MTRYKAWIGKDENKSMFVTCDTEEKAKETIKFFVKEVAPVLRDEGEPSTTGISIVEGKKCKVCERPVYEELHPYLCPRCENNMSDVASFDEVEIDGGEEQ